MRKRNKLIMVATLVLLGVGVVMGRFAYSQGFTKKWREYISGEFSERGLHLDFEKLTLDPVRGLVAREVTLYGDENRTVAVAKIDHISLDIDYEGLVGEELFLESFELKDADLWVRLDPLNAESERVEVKGFSARVYLTGDRIQIRRAEGRVNGIEVSLRGLLFQEGVAEGGAGVGEEEAGGGEGFQMKDLSGVVRLLREMEFDAENPPQLEIDIHGGDLAKLEDLEGTVHFVGSDLRVGRYSCKRVEALLETGRGAAVLKRFTVEDAAGRLEAHAEYHFGDDAVHFQVESEADLPGFLLGAMEWKPLAGVVFYEPRMLSWAGVILLDGEGGEGGLPVRAVGKLACGKITSRGKIFESLQTDFSIDEERFYVRNVALEHQTGGMSGEAMLDESGFRYRVLFTMDPRVFEPFFERAEDRVFLQRFDFGRESNVYAEVAGGGPGAEPSQWENAAEFELRNFTFDGVEVRKFGGKLQMVSGIHEYRDLEFALSDGEASAELVRVDRVNAMAEIRKFRGKVDMGEVLGCFDAGWGERIRGYGFREQPELAIDGVFDTGGGGRSALEVWVKAEEGFDWEVDGVVFPAAEVEAEVRLARGGAEVKLGGILFGGRVDGTVRVSGVGEEGVWSGEVGFEGVDLGDVVRGYDPGADPGGKMGGEVSFSGLGRDPGKWAGRGSVGIADWDVFGVPWLGGLSGEIGKMLGESGSGRGGTGTAKGEFLMEGGVVRVEAFEAEAPGMRLRIGGELDLVSDGVELEASAEVAGDEAEEVRRFKGSGKVRAPEWGH